jgi:hypothetical protein
MKRFAPCVHTSRCIGRNTWLENPPKPFNESRRPGMNKLATIGYPVSAFLYSCSPAGNESAAEIAQQPVDL